MGAIILAPRAERDLDRLRAFLLKDSARAAQAAVERIISALDLLLLFPHAGAAVRGGARQLIIRFGHGAYIARYMIRGDDIIVARLWHSLEKRPR